MITCNIMGGLGNQLFQIFTTISYALKYNSEFAFLYSEYVGTGKTIRRKTYWDNFLKSIIKNIHISLPNMYYLKEENFSYKELRKPLEGSNICLFGYFQSYKYFHEYSHYIMRLLNIENLKKNIIEKRDRKSTRLNSSH